MKYWLVKQEPDDYPFSQLQADGRTDWTGVRNYQARNFLRDMRMGDKVLYYHSGKEKAVVGTASVARAAFTDPTADKEDGDGWLAVELAAGKPFAQPVALAAIKADTAFKDLLLVRHSRLSVMPVSTDEFGQIVAMGEG
jgi:predicted RNA-binding protein with PUA-like domain